MCAMYACPLITFIYCYGAIYLEIYRKSQRIVKGIGKCNIFSLIIYYFIYKVPTVHSKTTQESFPNTSTESVCLVRKWSASSCALDTSRWQVKFLAFLLGCACVWYISTSVQWNILNSFCLFFFIYLLERFRRSNDDVLSRAKKRTLKMTITIVIVFIICWTPYYIICMWYWIDKSSIDEVSSLIRKGLFIFACTNSCMNPIVYGAFNIRGRISHNNTVSGC